MFRRILVVSVALALLKIFYCEDVDPEFSKAGNEFALDAYAKISAGKTGSLIFSPASIHQIITMLTFGAVGKTRTEMIAGLKYPEDFTSDEIAQNCEILTENLKQSNFLKMANKIYYMQGFTIKSAFKAVSKTSFGSESEALDFGNKQASADTINGWVAGQTNNKIKDLLSPGDFTNNTRLVLVNAIYFMGNWETPFKPADTRKESFYNSGVKATTVDMMRVKDYFKYKELPSFDATAIMLPYKDSDISMLIILPNTYTGLQKLEDNLKVTAFEDIVDGMNSIEVTTKIPKFKVETELVVNNVLQSMGMETMFSSKADFSGLLTGNEAVNVSKIIHKAFIEVNELGTEAAAATAVVMPGGGARETTFEANHPFVFAIFNGDGIYFTGRVEQF